MNVENIGFRQWHLWHEREGLPIPYIPPALARRLHQRGPAFFSTHRFDVSPYNIETFVDAWTIRAVPDYALVAHAGHGSNSCALHFFLKHGPLMLLLQLGWGGAYMNRQNGAAHIAQCFALAEALTREAEGLSPKLAGTHVFVAASDFYGSRFYIGRGRPVVTLHHHPVRVIQDLFAAVRLVHLKNRA